MEKLISWAEYDDNISDDSSDNSSLPRQGAYTCFSCLSFRAAMTLRCRFGLLAYMTTSWLDEFRNSERNDHKQKGYRLPALMPIVLPNRGRGWTAFCSQTRKTRENHGTVRRT